ncbi:replication initiation negative regulator SeqA [soil metagenome]
MQTIEVEDDVYFYLVKNISRIGEDASSILRRLLKIPVNAPVAPRVVSNPESNTETRSVPAPSGGIGDCLNHPHFRVERDAVGQFLFILAWLQKKHPDTFSRVLGLRGRVRTYFARSARDLEATGESVNPQRIPSTDYWVVTNNDTPKKKRILADVLKLLGYSPMDIIHAVDALR